MITKIYGIYGQTTAILRIPAGSGKAYLQCEFTRGRVNNKINNRPATYCSSDRTEQNIIEDSVFFKSGRIKLVRVYNDGAQSDAAPAAAPATTPAAGRPFVPEDVTGNTATDYPGITSREEAIGKLKELGAKAVDLRSTAGIKAVMDRLGVTFSNLAL